MRSELTAIDEPIPRQRLDDFVNGFNAEYNTTTPTKYLGRCATCTSTTCHEDMEPREVSLHCRSVKLLREGHAGVVNGQREQRQYLI